MRGRLRFAAEQDQRQAAPPVRQHVAVADAQVPVAVGQHVGRFAAGALGEDPHQLTGRPVRVQGERGAVVGDAAAVAEVVAGVAAGDVGDREARVEPQCLVVVGDGPREVVPQGPDAAAQVVDQRGLTRRAERQGAVAVGQRPVQVAGLFAGRGAVDVAGRVPRLQAQGRIVVGQGPLQVAGRVPQRRAVVQHRGPERLGGAGQGPVKVAPGAFHIALRLPGAGAVAQRLRVVGPEVHSAVEVGDGLRRAAEPQPDQAGVVPGFGEGGVGLGRGAEGRQRPGQIAPRETIQAAAVESLRARGLVPQRQGAEEVIKGGCREKHGFTPPGGLGDRGSRAGLTRPPHGCPPRARQARDSLHRHRELVQSHGQGRG